MPQRGVFVWFEVQGINSDLTSGRALAQNLGYSPADGLTDRNGEIRWSYANAGFVGVDTIGASVYQPRLAFRSFASTTVEWQAPPATPGEGTGLNAFFFDTVEPTTTPVVTAESPVVAFNYGPDSPAPGIPADNFSIRWTGQLQAQFSELYTIAVVSDDGARLWLDDKLVIDHWVDQGAIESSASVPLVAGQKYNLRLEFYDRGGDAVIFLLWSSPSTGKAIIPQSQLYTTPEPLVVSPGYALIVEGESQGFTVDGGGSVAWSVANGPWSVDVNGVYTAPSTVSTPQAVLLRADATDGSKRSGQTTILLVSAALKGTGDGLRGDYFQTINFSGPPLTRIDPTIDFVFGNEAPDPSLPIDLFTIRWTGLVQALTTETYTFSTLSDDGARLWLNGDLLIDGFLDQGPTTWTGNANLRAGQKYEITMDYYDAGGGAVAKLYWNSPSVPLQIIPQSQLYSTVTVTFDSLSQLTQQIVGDQALAKPLLTKLAAGQTAKDANARAGLIKAYIQQVNTARGKTLTTGEADLLILRAGQL